MTRLTGYSQIDAGQKGPFFIVSTGRSGTVTLAHVLSLVDGCTCEHEPTPQLILEASGYRYGTVSQAELQKTLIETRMPRAAREGIYCESNQTLALIIPVLAKTFPRARYIWLLRNGLDVVASAMQKQWYSGHSENHDRYEDCPPIERAWIDGRIAGHRCGDVSRDRWGAMGRFERCCWYWSYVNRLIKADLEAYAQGQSRLVRLERIDVELAKLIRWMGLATAIAPQPRRHNAAKRTPYHWTGWTDVERDQFVFWCGGLMDRYYPEWRSASATWNGVKYHRQKGYLSCLRRNYKLVSRVNAVFAPN